MSYEDFDSSGKLDMMVEVIDQPDWGAVILVDLGRIDVDDIYIDSQLRFREHVQFKAAFFAAIVFGMATAGPSSVKILKALE